MNIVRVYHRSRRRILIVNVLSMLVFGPIAYGIASLGQFQGPAVWIAIILFVANMGHGSRFVAVEHRFVSIGISR